MGIHGYTRVYMSIHGYTVVYSHICTIQHEKKVLDEIQVEHLQKKQLLNKATELLACLDKGMEYNWTPDQVGYHSRQLQAAKHILHSCIVNTNISEFKCKVQNFCKKLKNRIFVFFISRIQRNNPQSKLKCGVTKYSQLYFQEGKFSHKVCTMKFRATKILGYQYTPCRE